MQDLAAHAKQPPCACRPVGWLAGRVLCFDVRYQTFCNISITPEPWHSSYVIVIDTPTVIVFPFPDATHDTPLFSCREGEGEGEGEGEREREREGNEGGQAGNECPDRHDTTMTETYSSNIRQTTRSSSTTKFSFRLSLRSMSLPQCAPVLDLSTLYSNPHLVPHLPPPPKLLFLLPLPISFSASSVLFPQTLTRRNLVGEPWSPAERRVNRVWGRPGSLDAQHSGGWVIETNELVGHQMPMLCGVLSLPLRTRCCEGITDANHM